MTGRLIIDGVDAYSAFGVFVAEGGYRELMGFPPLKPVDVNEWWEYDGVEPDLSDPKLDTKSFSISFAHVGYESKFQQFIAHITNGAYHDFLFSDLGITFRLRLESQANYEVLPGLGLFSITVSDDFPLRGYTYAAPANGIARSQGHAIDDVDLASYGISVLEGSAAEALKVPAIRQNLLQNSALLNGVVYDGMHVKKSKKEIELKLLIRATTMSALWNNYRAFLYDLVRPEERNLLLSFDDLEHKCYYQSGSVETIIPSESWMKFSITMAVCSSSIREDSLYFYINGQPFLFNNENILIN